MSEKTSIKMVISVTTEKQVLRFENVGENEKEFSIWKRRTSPHLFIQHIQACHHVMAVVLR